jgi:hypothetical protein
MVECPKCGEKAVKYGKRKGKQRYQCRKGHIFTLEKYAPSPSLNLTVPTREGAPQPQLLSEDSENMRDVATEIIGSFEILQKEQKPEPEQKREPEPEPQPKLNPKDFNAPLQIGHFIGETIGDLLNEVFFKDKEKAKKQHEQSKEDYI